MADEFRSALPILRGLKAVADYETGVNSDIPPERSAAAIETASRFLDCIAGLLDDNV